jgi:hypothetical protein
MPADIPPHIFVAHDLQQSAYSLPLVAHQPAEKDSSAELPMPDSENQLAYDLAEFLQLADSAELYAKQVTILTNHY